MVIAERACQALNKKGEARAVSLDIWKAFDRVSYVVLIRKLKGYISGHISALFESVLKIREMEIILNGKFFFPRSFYINTGGTQRSI